MEREVGYQKIINKSPNNLFGRVTDSGLDLRIYDSALKGSTYYVDLSKTETLLLKENIDKLLKKEEKQIFIDGLRCLGTTDFSLKLTRSFVPNRMKVEVVSSTYSKTFLVMTVKTSEFVDIVNKALEPSNQTK